MQTQLVLKFNFHRWLTTARLKQIHLNFIKTSTMKFVLSQLTFCIEDAGLFLKCSKHWAFRDIAVAVVQNELHELLTDTSSFRRIMPMKNNLSEHFDSEIQFKKLGDLVKSSNFTFFFQCRRFNSFCIIWFDCFHNIVI